MCSKKVIIITLFFLFFPITVPFTLIVMYCPKFFMMCCCCMQQKLKENLVGLMTYIKYFLEKTCVCCVKYNRLSTDFLEYPLPQCWSDYNVQSQSFDQFFIQATGNAKKVAPQVLQKIHKSKDQSLSMIQASLLLERMDEEQRNNIKLISKLYNEQQYSFVQQGLFGQTMFNSQTPYIIRKLKYDPENKFQNQIFNTFNKANASNITTQNINLQFDIANLEQAAKKSLLYLLDFPNLRKLFKVQPVKNAQPTQGHVYLHIPYALFAKATQDGVDRLICLCSAFNFTQQNQIKVYSPYLKNQPYKLWNIVRMHIGGIVGNQFTLAFHLGILHFKSSRYNVPFYNFMNNSKDPQVKKAFYHVYQRFHIGLQGINTNGTAILLNRLFPKGKYSLFFTRSQTVQLIEQKSSNFKLQEYDPFTLQKELDLTNLITDQSQIYFDKKLYTILGNFIDKVSNHFNLIQYQAEIISQVNKIIPQNKITSLNQLMKRLANLWVIDHAHTFSNLSLSSYYKLNPTLIPKPLPFNISQISDKSVKSDRSSLNIHQHTDSINEFQQEKLSISQKQYMPNNPMSLVYFNKVIDGITISNPQNILLTVFRRSRSEIKDDNELVKIYDDTIDEFQKFTQQLNAANVRRMKKNKFGMTWLSPKRMQSSINI